MREPFIQKEVASNMSYNKYLPSKIKEAMANMLPTVELFLTAQDLFILQNNSVPYKKLYQISSVDVFLSPQVLRFLQEKSIPYKSKKGEKYQIPSVQTFLNSEDLDFLQRNGIPYMEASVKKCQVDVLQANLVFCH